VTEINGKRIAYFTTAPEPAHARLASHLRDVHGAADVVVSGNLARRDALRADLTGIDADVYLVEIKAAAIDIVAEAAAERAVPVVFADNEVVASGLDDALLELADLAIAAKARKNLSA
jgi:cyclic 2,3-diphosphoglycerate synthetase